MHFDLKKSLLGLLIVGFISALADKQEAHTIDQKIETVETNQDEPRQETSEEENREEIEIKEVDPLLPRTITDVVLTRNNANKYVSDDAILSCITYREGEKFTPAKTSQLIKNLYELGDPYSHFNQVLVMGEYPSDKEMILHVITYEKQELESIEFVGNKKIKTDDIEEKIKIKDIHAFDSDDIKKLELQLKKIYKDKNFHRPEFEIKIEELGENKVKIIVNVTENEKSLVKKVNFKGNDNISSKELRKLLITQEDWPLSFLTKAGTLKKEMLDRDRSFIEHQYRNNGFLTATVNKVEVETDPKTNDFCVTFHINEGELYTVGQVNADGNDICAEEFIINNIPIQQGRIYSQKEMQDSLESIRLLWGKYGYAFADVSPVMVPDEEKKIISVDFQSDLGEKVFINRINIKGNKKTKDKVIRRKIGLQEGCLLSTPDMDISKRRVEQLSFFDPRDGVTWKINRIDDKWADLDLYLKEIKTGKIGLDCSYGGSPYNMQSTSTSFKIGGYVNDPNWMGSGIGFSTSAHWSKQEWDFNLNFSDNWFLGYPIYSDLNLGYVKSDYSEQLKNVEKFDQRVVSAFFGLGYTTAQRPWLNETTYISRIGIEHITQNRPVKVDDSEEGSSVLQILMNRMFQPGKVISFEHKIFQDVRNNNIHPNSGYQWSASTKIGHGIQGCKFGYGKLELEGSYYTPLIAPYTLVLGLHAFLGIVGKTGKDKSIPYRELFHIGGPSSVRGYEFGQIGPTLMGNSIGGKRAFFVNAELIFPLSGDLSMKGALFYDGGAGWDTPDLNLISTDIQKKLLKNNKFSFRQSVGFGIRMLKPQPIKVDWGFKLDKKEGEKTYELHLSAYREF